MSAAGYFASALEVDVDLLNPTPSSSKATFRVYYTPPVPRSSHPTESHQQHRHGDHAESTGQGVVFVCVHGAGYSGLSWALLGKSVVDKSQGKVGVLAYDARGHGELCEDETTVFDGRVELTVRVSVWGWNDLGKTRITSSSTREHGEHDEQPEMSLESLSSDLVSLLKTMFPDRATAPAFLLVGHSMVRSNVELGLPRSAHKSCRAVLWLRTPATRSRRK